MSEDDRRTTTAALPPPQKRGNKKGQKERRSELSARREVGGGTQVGSIQVSVVGQPRVASLVPEEGKDGGRTSCRLSGSPRLQSGPAPRVASHRFGFCCCLLRRLCLYMVVSPITATEMHREGEREGRRGETERDGEGKRVNTEDEVRQDRR